MTTEDYQRRRAIRDQVDDSEATIFALDQQVRDQLGDQVPPMTPTADALDATPTAAMTVSSDWLAWMFRHLAGAPKIDPAAELYQRIRAVATSDGWPGADVIPVVEAWLIERGIEVRDEQQHADEDDPAEAEPPSGADAVPDPADERAWW